MNKGEIIKFDASKNFTYIKPLGNGGTGDTHLFKDETTDMMFAIKKYVPKDKKYVDEYYKRFVDEIKILFNISHPNIVRIYNYYLYPESKTGYLQMEYISGTTIDKYEILPWSKSWNDIFTEIISAFEYLEDNNILHRDIRSANILIDENDNVKIIDFGFSKMLDVSSDSEQNSVLLNWPVTEMPDEVSLHGEYNEQTEIFFIGKLFKHIYKDGIETFRYNHILEKMIKISPNERYMSFHEIANDISEGILSEINFTDKEKQCYRDFADDLTYHIFEFYDKYTPITDISIILSGLSELIRVSSLEEVLQDNSSLISCFVSNGYRFDVSKEIEIMHIIEFYKLVTSLSANKRKIIFDNLFKRLSKVKIIPRNLDDFELPF